VKGTLWLLVLFLIAVSVTLAARYNSGYVLIVADPYRVELSLNLLAILLLVIIIIGYFAVRLSVLTLRLPTEVAEFRSRRRRDKARKAMLDGFKAFFEGQYAVAEKAAATALKWEESPAISAMNAMVAARSAHGLRNYSRRDEFIALAESSAPKEVMLRLMGQAEFLLDENRSDEALKILHSLPPVEPGQYTAALQLELKAQQRSRNWNAVLELLGKLEQRNAIDLSVMRNLRRRAHVENVRSRVLNPQALKEYWQHIPADDKKDNKLAFAAAQAFMGIGDCAMANQIIEQSLDNQWDSELVELYAKCVENDSIRQIERAEAWLAGHPNDACLLLALGKLCVYCELWGKAQNYLEASLSVEPDYQAHLALAQLNEKLERLELAKDHYSKGFAFALRRFEASGAGAAE
jgi:HemY protein